MLTSKTRDFILFIIFFFATTQLAAKDYSALIKDKTGDSCYDCHKILPGKAGEVVKVWQKSVHGVGEKKCNMCHAGNANEYDKTLAKSKDYNYVGIPQKLEIIDFCGRIECHSISMFQIKKSPHYETVAQKGHPSCISCHGSHNIEKTARHIITDKTCSDCHSLEYSAEVIDMLFKTEDDFIKIQKDIDYLINENADVWEISSLLDESKRLFYQLTHIMSREEMEHTRKVVALQIETLQQNIKEKIAMVKRLSLLYNLTIINIAGIIIGFIIYYLILYIRRNVKKGKKE